MNCYYHADASAVAFCRSCGRPVCQVCQRLEGGTVYCPDHAAVNAAAPGEAGNPYFQPANTTAAVQTAPWLAFALGWIPGVGAIYNGQYIKGLVHAVIFGLLVSLISSNGNENVAPFLGILLSAFLFYMPFEAFHTARKRQQGIPVDEWSSLAGTPSPSRVSRGNSAGPIILIGIGILFLLDTLDLIEFRHIGRFWPILLIAAGIYMLYSRTTGSRAAVTSPPSGGTSGYGANSYSASYGNAGASSTSSGSSEGPSTYKEEFGRDQ